MKECLFFSLILCFVNPVLVYGVHAGAPLVKDQIVTTNVNTPTNLTLSVGNSSFYPLAFTITTMPMHGKLSSITNLGPTSAKIVYDPKLDYNGTDRFTYNVKTANGITSNIGTVVITVNPPLHQPNIPGSSSIRAMISFVLALVLDVGILYVARRFIKYHETRKQKVEKFPVGAGQVLTGVRVPSTWKNVKVKGLIKSRKSQPMNKITVTGQDIYFIPVETENDKTLKVINQESRLKFGDIIRDDNWYPSLATFQFWLWTMITIFAFASVSLIRIFGGYPNLNVGIPESLLSLMGIAVAVPAINSKVSQIKYGGTTPPQEPPTKAVPIEPKRLPSFNTIIMENSRPTLARFQMFAWTWISIIIYLIIFFSATLDPSILGNVQKLGVPDINPVFVLLMGLSQGAYLGTKLATSTVFSINGVRPNVGVKPGDSVSILGSNFGDSRRIILFEHYSSRDHAGKDDEDEDKYNPNTMDEQVKVNEKDIQWSDTRIDVKVPMDIKVSPNGKYYVVRVEKDGLETYATSDAELQIYPLLRKFNATLSANDEIPAKDSPATGDTEFELSSDAMMLSCSLNVKDIDKVTMACINKGKKGENGPKVVTLFKGAEIESPVIDPVLRRQAVIKKIIPTGSITSERSLHKDIVTADKFEGPLEGKQMSDLVKLIDDGNVYVNVHTERNPEGEIRGQVTVPPK